MAKLKKKRLNKRQRIRKARIRAVIRLEKKKIRQNRMLKKAKKLQKNKKEFVSKYGCGLHRLFFFPLKKFKQICFLYMQYSRPKVLALQKKKKRVIFQKNLFYRKFRFFSKFKYHRKAIVKKMLKRKYTFVYPYREFLVYKNYDIYTHFFFTKFLGSILPRGYLLRTKLQFFKSFIFLKKNKKIPFLFLYKLLILLKSPFCFKYFYRYGVRLSAPMQVPYLYQWFLCFKLFKKLEKTRGAGSFLSKLKTEYRFVYNQLFLEIYGPLIKNKKSIRHRVFIKKKRTFRSLPVLPENSVTQFSFLLTHYQNKNDEIVDNRSYFNYRW